jgi:CRISPR/Cas system endoribonuclease Cas6 (RAMP superfamily)
VTFQYLPLRFRFVALTAVSFSKWLPGNAIRSALGASLRRAVCAGDCEDPTDCGRGNDCPYLYLFQPTLEIGPSGMRHPPRPFTIRARPLAGRPIAPGERFELGINLFELRRPAIEWLVHAFSRWKEEGQGPARSTVLLESVEVDRPSGTGELLVADGAFLREQPEPVSLSVESIGAVDAKRMEIEFLSPTEFKENGSLVESPSFAVLMRRIAERVNALATIYGAGPLSVDWSCLNKAAETVRTTYSGGVHAPVKRTSRKTGSHPLGGFVGEIVYEGDLSMFVPWLRIAEVTGVGRQTVWGKGEIRVRIV